MVRVNQTTILNRVNLEPRKSPDLKEEVQIDISTKIEKSGMEPTEINRVVKALMGKHDPVNHLINESIRAYLTTRKTNSIR
jgi:hypothetical protein